MSPRHHGQGSTSPGAPAGEVRRPRTFSITTRQGRRAWTARTTCSQSPERVWSLSPARRPATETSLTGEAGRQDTHPRDGEPVDGGDVAQVGDAGPVAGQDARGVRIDLGVPGRRATEGGLHAQVEAAVPRAERPDQRGTRWGDEVRRRGAMGQCRGGRVVSQREVPEEEGEVCWVVRCEGWPREGGRAAAGAGTGPVGAGGDAARGGVLRARAACTRAGGGPPVDGAEARVCRAGPQIADAPLACSAGRGCPE